MKGPLGYAAQSGYLVRVESLVMGPVSDQLDDLPKAPA